MTRNDAIRRVSVISTGTVQIHPEHMACTWQPTFLWVLTSRRWTAPRPINVYVIEHRDGLVVFDTGQDRASALVGDLTYDVRLLKCGHVPGVGDRRMLRRSTAMLNQLRETIPGLVVLATHDPGAAAVLAEAETA